ncbi:MAG: Rrf2 family transcriptional regulator [Ignavibacteriales bacterium]|nr:Rrf2 family transcriptional regulator [Ignavibacteriales bacterium]
MPEQNESRDMQIDELQKHNAELTEQNTVLMERNSELTNRNSELKNQNVELSRQNSELKNQYAELSQQNVELKSQNAELLRLNAELKSGNAAVTSKKQVEKRENEKQTTDKVLFASTVTPQSSGDSLHRLDFLLTDDVLRNMGMKIGLDQRREQVMQILFSLHEQTMLTLKELSARTKIPEDTLMRLIRRLTEMGWVRRLGGQKFGGYRLTEEGKRLFGA